MTKKPVLPRKWVMRWGICIIMTMLYLGLGIPAGKAQPSWQTFSYTGSFQTYTVPDCATAIEVDVKGAQGGTANNGFNLGGQGGRVQAVIPVMPGETLQIRVGGAGSETQAGWNGGGAPGTVTGAGGGGASDIRSGGSGLNDRIVVAAGGGGGGGTYATNAYGGCGGGLNGCNGSGNSSAPGQGASQSSGGSGSNVNNGGLGYGGNGGPHSGGGGSGYYGGSSGNTHSCCTSSGGGGGSSWAVPSATNVTHTSNTQTGNGEIRIRPVPTEITVTAQLDELNSDTICPNIPVTFTAQDTSFFNEYRFFINGTLGQDSTAHTFTTTALQDGDDVYVEGVYAGSCPVVSTVPSESISMNVSAQAQTVADFSYDNTQGLAVAFHDSSVLATSHHWDFGDNDTAAEKSPQHTYAQPGQYEVCLTVSSACGQDTLCDSIEVCEQFLPAMFGYTTNKLTVQFADSTQNADSWLWRFGDGDSATIANPAHTYDTVGTYVVTLYVGNDCNQKDTFTAMVTVTCDLQTTFTVDSIAPRFVKLQNTAVDYDSLRWDFGDSTTSTSTNSIITHAYDTGGTYTVCLVAYSACGSPTQDTVCQIVSIPQFADVSFCSGSATIENYSFEDDPVGTSLGSISQWNYRNGTSNWGGNSSNWSNTPGNFEVEIVGTHYFSSSQGVRFFLEGGDGCNPTRYFVQELYSDYTSTSADYITFWVRDVSYSTPSRYSFQYRAVVEDSTNREQINLFCTGELNCEACPGNSCFDSSSGTAVGADGETWKRYTFQIPAAIDKSNMRVAIRHYQSAWSNGCANSTFYADNVCFSDANGNCVVVADTALLLTSDTICEGGTLNLTASPANLPAYHWTGPNGFSSSQQDTAIRNVTTAHAGAYTVVITDTDGCADTATANVVVSSSTLTAGASSNSPVCEGETLFLSGTPDSMSGYSWSGPDNFSSNEQNPAINNVTAANSGAYTFTVTQENGCEDEVSINADVRDHSEATLTPTVCDASYTSPSGDYTWDTSGTYYDTIPNTAGCDSALIIQLTVKGALNTGVAQTEHVLEAVLSGATYQWGRCKDGFEPIDGATDRKFVATENGDYAVVITEGGCTNTSACYSVTTLSVLENSFGTKVTLHPNPSEGHFTIDLGKTHRNLRIKVFTLEGRKIRSATWEHHAAPTVDISDMPPGTYIVQVVTEAGQAVFRVVKE